MDSDDSGAVNGGESAIANGNTVTTANLAKLTWAPAANANGATYATFTFTVNDGNGNSASSYTATLAVTAQNDAPANAGTPQRSQRTSLTMDGPQATDWGYSDVDGDTMASVLIIGCPATGTLTIGGNACGWVLNGNIGQSEHDLIHNHDQRRHRQPDLHLPGK